METKVTLDNPISKIIQSDQIILNSYSKNITGLTKQIGGIAFPSSPEEIINLVKHATKNNLSLYPISKGKNWGYGSKLPVTDNCIIVDLSNMNKIHEINEEYGYAIIEPGVTQIQLYNEIEKRGLDYILNCTGSADDTSIIGNCLERGIGYYSMRQDDVLNFDVILGNGEIISTGFGNGNTNIDHICKYGMGPGLDGLFFQSNFGIILKMTFKLIPKPEKITMISCGLLKEDNFNSYIDCLRDLRKKGIIKSHFRIGNENRSKSTIIPILQDIILKQEDIGIEKAREKANKIYDKNIKTKWTAIGPIYGNKNEVNSNLSAIRKVMSKFGSVEIITENKLKFSKEILNAFRFIPAFRDKLYLLNAVEPLIKLSFGVPTSAALKSINYFSQDKLESSIDPDSQKSGLWFVAPIIPFNNQHADKLNAYLDSISKKYRVECFISMNMGTENYLQCVINIYFNKENKNELDNAYAYKSELFDWLLEQGYYPYRVGIDDMNKIIKPDHTYWKLVHNLKKVLDPNNIIAPGRYNF